MSHLEMGKGALQTPPPNCKLSNLREQPDSTTAVNPVNTCGHSPAPVRNVTRPDGDFAYVCAACFNHLRNVEWRAVVRSQFANLFGGLRPPAIHWLGGLVVDRLLARALEAAYRDKSYRPWIWAAGVVARLAEGRAYAER